MKRLCPKLVACIFHCFVVHTALAQVYVEQGRGFQHDGPMVSVYGPDAWVKRIPLSRVSGSPFFNEQPTLASLFDRNAKLIRTVPARMNLATGQLHFIWNDRELAADDQSMVAAVVFHPNNDTSKVEALFVKNIPNLMLHKKPVNEFVQVLNPGQWQLLKYTTRQVLPDRDSLFGTQKRYKFRDINYYFLRSGDKVEKLKRLNEENIMSVIPPAANYKEWILVNKIELTKEEQVVDFLEFVNAATSSPSQR